MTTIKRKWNHAPIVLGLFLILAGTNTYAEDNAVDTTQSHAVQQQQVKVHNQQAYDQQYKMPPSYNGNYYPSNDDNTAVGYHGTSNSARNDAGSNGSYYYYYQ